MSMSTALPLHLSDGELVAAVARLAGSERAATVALIAHLAELYSRRLHERAGFSSLFTYCMEVLRLSEQEAYDRMKAAKLARRFPAILELLTSRRINLTTVRLLAPHLTRDNCAVLLAETSGKRKRQVQELLASRFPQPVAAPSIRKVPARSGAPVVGSSARSLAAVGVGPTRDGIPPTVTPAARAPLLPPQTRPVVEPVAPDRYRFAFTAGGEARELFDLGRDLLRHAVPSGDPGEIFTRALKRLVEDLVKHRYAVTSRPGRSDGQAEDSRNIPAEVKRAVFLRDRGRCAYVAPDRRRCGERAFVEFHHIRPYAAGGRPTVSNIALRCRAHNGYEAEVFYEPAKRDADTEVAREEAGGERGTEEKF